MRTLAYISLGAGVQSTALLAMSNLGLQEIAKADVAIFADTGDEPGWVYEHLALLESWSRIPIERVTAGCISADLRARIEQGGAKWFSTPAFTADGGILRRQCTREYKISAIHKRARELLGLRPGERSKGKAHATAMIGISWDEALRMKPSQEAWITKTHPLVDRRLTRADCVRIVGQVGLPVPKKSACVHCPYHDDAYWLDLKRNYPEEFARACEVERMLWRLDALGLQKAFLHRSLVPLDEVKFRHEKQNRMDFMNECEGLCGV